jgi:AraC family transcriptional regulator of adaptative response / DNA-3-methyladenine glycosylase II
MAAMSMFESPPSAGLAPQDDPQAHRHLYQAWLARDARFDGRVFVGVTSTRIYCRPVCRVRPPLARNCRFFGHAALAEQAGYRPCLRCRPEQAPGLALVDSSDTLARHAARLLEAAALEGREAPMPEVAARLGVSDRHLRRIFRAVHGVGPLDYLATRRLLLAKQLLTDTALPVTQVALSAGFSSLRRFNAAFAERYRMSPSVLRRHRAEEPEGGPGGAEPPLRIRLGYRPPLDAEALVGFFAHRAVAGQESADPATLSLRRTVAWHGADGTLHRGWLAGRFLPERSEVAVEAAPALAPALGALVLRLRHGLDLDADPDAIEPALAGLPGADRPGIRVPGALDGFESATRIVLGQQVSVAAARTITTRLVHALGEPIATPFADLTHLFPRPEAVLAASEDTLGRLGIVRQRQRALKAIAQAMLEGRLELHPAAPLEATLDALRALPGVGEWTVQLIALRTLAWPDAFPASDIGVLNALGHRDAKRAEEQSQAWRPWRAYAVMRLWRALETQAPK